MLPFSWHHLQQRNQRLLLPALSGTNYRVALKGVNGNLTHSLCDDDGCERASSGAQQIHLKSIRESRCVYTRYVSLVAGMQALTTLITQS